jgi:hypothetical protein
MATKDIILKKKLIKQGIIMLIVLGVLASGGFLLSNRDDDAQAEKHSHESQSAAMQSEHDSIKDELGSNYYNTYAKSHNVDLIQNRQEASDLFYTLREKNHIATDLVVDISPIMNVTPEIIHLKSGVLSKSEVTLKFSAVADSSIYGYIESIQRELPGFVIIEKLTFEKAGELSNDVIKGLSQHQVSSVIKADLTFIWLGIHPPEDPKKANSSTSGAR